MKNIIIAVFSITLLSGCWGKKEIDVIYDSSISSRSVEIKTLSEIRWRSQWADAFNEASKIQYKEGSLGEKGEIIFPLKEAAYPDLLKALDISDIELNDHSDLSEGGVFKQKIELAEIAGKLEHSAQKLLKTWVSEHYKSEILELISPSVYPYIKDIDFNVSALANGSQSAQTKFVATLLVPEKVKASYEFNDSTQVKFEEGQPLLFDVLYTLELEKIPELFNDYSGRNKKLSLENMPMRFYYFPKVIWMINSNHTLSASDVNEKVAKGSLQYTEIEDKTLSFSISNPVPIPKSDAYSLYFDKNSTLEEGANFKSFGKGLKLSTDDYYPPFLMKLTNSEIILSSGFQFLVRDNQNSKLIGNVIKVSDISDKLYTVIPEHRLFSDPTRNECPQDKFVKPISFIQFIKDKKTSSVNFKQLLVIPYTKVSKKSEKIRPLKGAGIKLQVECKT